MSMSSSPGGPTSPEAPPRAKPASLNDLFVSFTLLALQGFGGVLAVVQRELVEKKRSIVRMQNGQILAKCEFSAVTTEAVQLMGVWTDLAIRRRGFGRALLREVCGHLARKGKSVTLFVNDFNRPAIALYESLGFRQIGVNRALIW